MTELSRELEQLLDSYPREIKELALATRQMVNGTIPNLLELVDSPAKVIGYGFGAGYKDMICTIILSQKNVKLGIVGGASLPDPKGLLTGTGSRHRYVEIARPSDLKKPGLKSLLTAALDSWKRKTTNGPDKDQE